MIVICHRWWLPKAYVAITLFPFIFIKWRPDIPYVTINHEMIHIEQQKEMLVVPAQLWYCIEYLIKLVYYLNSEKAYRAISFEREAYANDWNFDYLNTRKRYSFIKYVYIKRNNKK